MKKSSLILGLALLSIPAVGSAQVEMSTRTQARATAETGTSAEAAARVTGNLAIDSGRNPATSEAGQAAVSAALAEGLPTGAIDRIIAEGRARGESAAVIDRAAFAIESRLSASARALRTSERPSPSAAEIEAGAQALLGGARPGDLQRIREAAPAGRDLTASLSTLADLSANGANPSRAAAELAAELEAGASDKAVSGLATSASAAGRLGTSLGGVGDIGASAVGAGVGAGIAAGLGATLIGG